MKKKILILGRTGMLGHMVLAVLSNSDNLLVFGTQCDSPKEEFYFDVEKGIGPLKEVYDKNKGFDYFVNCIGVTNSKINTNKIDSIIKVIQINSMFPHELAKFAERNNVKVIHISTDGVFLGNANTYDEFCVCDCVDFYGKTKSLGEVLNSNNVINIRCSIIGPSPFEKGGLFEWLCAQPEGAKVSGYTNHVWNGVTTLQFATLCQSIISSDMFDKLRQESAVFHFSPNKPVSKYELLNILKQTLGKRIDIKPAAAPGGTVRRVLVSSHDCFKKLYTDNFPIEEAVKEMVALIGETQWQRRN